MEPVRLTVVKHTPDEAHSLDCILCDENANTNHFTVCVFDDKESGSSFCLCPEHLDGLVTAAFKRHLEGLKDGDAWWYLTEDKDPWRE
jgi:phage/plasmid primase-like uncharacterized protein